MRLIRFCMLVCVAVGVAVVLGGCEYSEIDGVGTRTADEEHPPQYDLATFNGCEPGDLGQWRFNAEVVNNTPTVASYELTVAFYEGDTRLDEFSSWVRDLKPGERALVDTGWWIDGADRVTRCEVLTINRWG
jgi:hypothetical protein